MYISTCRSPLFVPKDAGLVPHLQKKRNSSSTKLRWEVLARGLSNHRSAIETRGWWWTGIVSRCTRPQATKQSAIVNQAAGRALRIAPPPWPRSHGVERPVHQIPFGAQSIILLPRMLLVLALLHILS